MSGGTVAKLLTSLPILTTSCLMMSRGYGAAPQAPAGQAAAPQGLLGAAQETPSRA